MKKLIYILVLAISVSTVYAQSEKAKKEGDSKVAKDTKEVKAPTKSETPKGKENKQTPDDRANKITAKLKEVLVLTDDQVIKVKAITLTRVNSIKAAKVTSKDNKEAFGQERKKIFIAWNASLKEILTADQMAKLKVYREEKKNAKKDGKSPSNDDDDDSIDE